MLFPGSARILAQELTRAKTIIMALQEVRWRGARETAAGGDHILWCGPPDGQPRRSGVALALDQVTYEGRSKSFATWHDNVKMSMHGMHQ